MSNLNVVIKPTNELRENPANARTHSDAQVEQIAKSIQKFGFNNPILVDAEGMIIAGHGRVAAAKILGLKTLPTVQLDHLSEAQKRAYVIADNRLAELAGWDREILAIEFQFLVEEDIEFELTDIGFSAPEIDVILTEESEANADPDIAEFRSGPPVTVPGDLWLIGPHRLLCGNALDASSYEKLMGSEQAEMIFTDPPYNVPITGHVSGLGRARHEEFAMAAGEMSKPEFTRFLSTVFRHMAAWSTDGSIHFVCMDWRHLLELLRAGQIAYSELKNICVWAKANGGMGSLYRSQHELVAVFKNGTGSAYQQRRARTKWPLPHERLELRRHEWLPGRARTKNLPCIRRSNPPR